MNTFNTTLKAQRLIFIAMLLGQVFFLTAITFIHFTQEPFVESSDLFQIFLIISLAACVLSHIVSPQIAKSKLQNMDHSISLEEKMIQYRSTLIVKLAILQGANFFTIICFLLTGNLIFVGIAALMILLFLTKIPTKEKIIFELQLRPEEQQKIT